MTEEIIKEYNESANIDDYDKSTIRLFFVSTAELYYLDEKNNSIRVLDKLIFNFPQGNIYLKDYNNLIKLAKEYLIKKYNIISKSISDVNVLWLYPLATCTEYDFYTKGGQITNVSRELKEEEEESSKITTETEKEVNTNENA